MLRPNAIRRRRAVAAAIFCVSTFALRAAEDTTAAADDPADAPAPSAAPRFDPARALGGLLARLPGERPEWQDMLIAILEGEAMSPRNAWWRPSASLYGFVWLRERFDRDGNGRVDRAELAGAEDLFAGLDRDADGVIAAADLEAPAPVRPEVDAVFRSIDHDDNGKVSWEEVSWFFQQADRKRRGFLSPEDLQAFLQPALAGDDSDDDPAEGGGEASEPMPSRRRLLALHLRQELGSWASGPALGEAAPPLRLAPRDGDAGREIAPLAEHLGERPVVLIFGSFT